MKLFLHSPFGGLSFEIHVSRSSLLFQRAVSTYFFVALAAVLCYTDCIMNAE